MQVIHFYLHGQRQFIYAVLIWCVQNNNSIQFGSQSNLKQENMSVLFFLIFFLENSLCQSNPKVCLDSICFTGSWITTNKGLKFASFQGIKYGQDPVGKLRFKPPQASKTFLQLGLQILCIKDGVRLDNLLTRQMLLFDVKKPNHSPGA